jgi:hypothetical protein
MSDKVGLHESFSRGQDFLLVLEGASWRECLEHMQKLAPADRRAMGRAAREAAMRSFSWSGICTRIEALL